MAFSDNQRKDYPPRKMFQVDQKCADCGAEIKELPFQPRPDSKVYCRDCYAKNRPPRFER